MKQFLPKPKNWRKIVLICISLVISVFSYAGMPSEDIVINDHTKVKAKYVNYESGVLIVDTNTTVNVVLAAIDAPGSNTIIFYDDTYTPIFGTDTLKNYYSMEIEYLGDQGSKIINYQIYAREKFVAIDSDNPFVRFEVYDYNQTIFVANETVVEDFLNALYFNEATGSLKLYWDYEKTELVDPSEVLQPYMNYYLEAESYDGLSLTDYEIYTQEIQTYFDVRSWDYCEGDIIEFYNDIGFLPIGAISKWYLNDQLVFEGDIPSFTLLAGEHRLRRVIFNKFGDYLGEHEYYDMIHVGGAPDNFKFSTGDQACPGSDVRAYFDYYIDYTNIRWKVDGQEFWDSELYYRFDQEGDYEVTVYLDFNTCASDSITQILHVTNTAVSFAEIETDGHLACINDEISFRVRNQNYNDNYTWDFGDGTVLNGPEGMHSYAADGTYEVLLSVTNVCGQTGTSSKLINIESNVPAENNFNYWTQGYYCPGAVIQLQAFSPGETYKWTVKDNMGDIYRTLYGKNSQFQIDTTGSFNIELKVINGCGNVAIPNEEDYHNIDIWLDDNNIPYVYFEMEVDDGWMDTVTVASGTTIEFESYSDNSSNNKYYWNFGDGPEIDSVNVYRVEHQFVSAIDVYFEVSLIALNSCGGRDTARRWVHIDPNMEFIIPLQVLPDTICPGESVAFYVDGNDGNGGDGLILGVDYGDGGQVLEGIPGEDYSNGIEDFEINFNKIYNTEGVYNYEFFAEDAGGMQDTLYGTIVVTTDPHAPFYYVGSNASKDNDPGQEQQEGEVIISFTMENPDSVYFLQHDLLFPGTENDTVGWYVIGTSVNQGEAVYPISSGTYTFFNSTGQIQFIDDPVDAMTICTESPALYQMSQDEFDNDIFTSISDGCAERVDHLTGHPFFNPNAGSEEEYNDDWNPGVCPGDTVQFNIFGGLSYEWHFMGDEVKEASTTDRFVKYVYETEGIYNPYVEITNGCGTIDTFYLELNITGNYFPDAYFDMDRYNAGVADPVAVKVDSWSGESLNNTYTFDFGDGTVVNDVMEYTHSYDTPGEYQISLTVTNGCGSNTHSNFIFIDGEILNENPLADAGMGYPCYMGGLSPGTVWMLDASASLDHLGGVNLIYNWIAPEGINLDDPSSPTPEFVVPFFDNEQELIFGLEVTDNVNGLMDFDFIPICINGRKTIFVSPYGNDYDYSEFAGTEEYPLETVTEALYRAGSGDRIILKSGDYYTTNNVYVSMPVYIGVEEGGIATLHGDGMSEMFIVDAMDLGDPDLKVIIDGVYISDVSTAISVYTSALIKGCLIDYADYGIWISESAINTEIQRNVITNFNFEGIASEGSADIYNNTVVGGLSSAIGINFSMGSGGVVNMYNNIIAHNDIGVNNSSALTINSDYNLYFNTTNYSGFTAGLNKLELDPLLIDYMNYDFGLMQASPCIDAGMPGSYDPDATLSDIGAFFFFQANEIQNIMLTEGWNIISSFIAPNKTNMLSIMQPLIDNNQLVKVMDESGKALEYVVDDWVNLIGDGSGSEGYLINVNANTQLPMVGQYHPLPLEIELKSGWNIIGYPYMYPQPLSIFTPIVDKLVKIQDETGATFENVATIGFVNHIGELKPGKGYKVNMNEFALYDYMETGIVGKVGVVSKSDTKENHFSPTYNGNGYEHMNIYAIDFTINGLKMDIGDEIAIYDDTQCVGVAVVTNPDAKYLSIIASKDDPITIDKDGFKSGNSIKFRVWDASEEIEISTVEANFASGYSSDFASLGTSIVSLNALYATTDIIGVDNMITQLGESYPNPFRSTTQLEFSLERGENVTIEVFDILGRKVATLIDSDLNAGIHKITWNGTSDSGVEINSGTYFFKMRAGEFTSVKQVMLNR